MKMTSMDNYGVRTWIVAAPDQPPASTVVVNESHVAKITIALQRKRGNPQATCRAQSQPASTEAASAAATPARAPANPTPGKAPASRPMDDAISRLGKRVEKMEATIAAHHKAQADARGDLQARMDGMEAMFMRLLDRMGNAPAADSAGRQASQAAENEVEGEDGWKTITKKRPSKKTQEAAPTKRGRPGKETPENKSKAKRAQSENRALRFRTRSRSATN